MTDERRKYPLSEFDEPADALQEAADVIAFVKIAASHLGYRDHFQIVLSGNQAEGMATILDAAEETIRVVEREFKAKRFPGRALKNSAATPSGRATVVPQCVGGGSDA